MSSHDGVFPPHPLPTQVLQPYTHIDLLAPIPGVYMGYPRTLFHHDTMRFKGSEGKDTCHVFVFTDVLLIAKALKRGGDSKLDVIVPVSAHAHTQTHTHTHTRVQCAFIRIDKLNTVCYFECPVCSVCCAALPPALSNRSCCHQSKGQW